MFKKIIKYSKWILGFGAPGYFVFEGYKRYKKRLSRVRVLMNPMAGKGDVKQTFRKIKEALNKRIPNSKIEILFSRTQGDLSYLAKKSVEDRIDMVVVAGGDGAVNEVIQGLANSDVVLGVIPLGTGNAFAQEIKISNDIDQACEILATGKIKRVDMGKISDKYFLWLAGFGIDALVAQELTQDIKDRLGVFSYFVFALKHLKKIPYAKVKITTEEGEQVYRAFCVIVGNITTYDGRLNIKATESMDDGFLDICIAQTVTPLGIINQILWFLLGRKTYYRSIRYFDVKYFKTKKIKIESEPPIFVHTDGEVIGQTPCECTIVPKSLSIILP